MDNIQNSKANHRLFAGYIIGLVLVYVVMTLILNNIRATISLWILWPLVIIQFGIYCYIFGLSYLRATELGLKNTMLFILFVILALLGRVNDWEILVIPITVLGIIIFSAIKSKTPLGVQ